MDNMEKEKETQQTEVEQETCSCPECQQAPEAECAQPKEDWKEQYQQLNDKYIRVLAEYDNYRKRSQKERDSVFSDAQAMTVEQLLPVLDNLDRALEQKPASLEELLRLLEQDRQFAAPGKSVEQLALEHLEAERIRFCLAQLTDEERKLISLLFYQEKTEQEVGNIFI